MSAPEGSCIFCKDATDDPLRLGEKFTRDGFSVHYYCMVSRGGLVVVFLVVDKKLRQKVYIAKC